MSSAGPTATGDDAPEASSVAPPVTDRRVSGDIMQRLPAEIRDNVLSCLGPHDMRSLVRASPAMYERYLANQKLLLFWKLHDALRDEPHAREPRGLYAAFFARRVTALRDSGPWRSMHLRHFVLREATMRSRRLGEYSDRTIERVYRESSTADVVEMARFHGSVVRRLKRSSEFKHCTPLALYNFEIWCNHYGSGRDAIGRRVKAPRSHMRDFLSQLDIEKGILEEMLDVNHLARRQYMDLLDRFIKAHRESTKEGGDPETLLERPEWFERLATHGKNLSNLPARRGPIPFYKCQHADSSPRRVRRITGPFYDYIVDAMASRGLHFLCRVWDRRLPDQELDQTVKDEVAIALRGVDTESGFSDEESFGRLMRQLGEQGVNRLGDSKSWFPRGEEGPGQLLPRMPPLLGPLIF